MLVHELVTRLLQLQAEGYGNNEIRDTDGNPIIGVSLPDSDLPTQAERDALHIEAEF